MNSIPVRLGIQQRVLPFYRAPFFETLATLCQRGLGVIAGQPRPDEAIEPEVGLQNVQLTMTRNLHLFRGPFYLCWQRGLLDWLESWQPEVLVVEANPRYLRTPAAVRWMRARRRPVIGWGLGAPLPGRAFSGLRCWLRGLFLAQFDALITYSQQGAQQYRSAGFAPERIFIAPNAAAPRPRQPLPQRPAEFPDRRGTVLFIGRLQARKRVDLLLRACAALPQDQQPALWIVGDGPARAELENLAHQVYPAAQFLGARRGPELEQWLRQADLFALPGTGGLAIQQAMSFGLPVIAAEADGTQADLVRPANGWLIQPGDLDSLATALRQALADPARLRRMGRESYRIVAEEINLETMAECFGRAVRSVWAGRAAGEG